MVRGSSAEPTHEYVEPRAEEIADNIEARPSDRLAALQFLARYGLGRLIEARVRDYEPCDEKEMTAIEARLEADPELAEVVEELFRRFHPAEPIDLRRLPRSDGA